MSAHSPEHSHRSSGNEGQSDSAARRGASPEAAQFATSQTRREPLQMPRSETALGQADGDA